VAENQVERILREEDNATRTKVARRDTAETGRRREEMLRDLGQLVAELEAEKDDIEARLARFHKLRDAIRALSDDADETALAELKRALREAHIELVKHHREGLAGEPVGGGVELASLGLGQLSRIGFGLGWPLVAGMVLAALIVALVLFALFHVG
jgi:hypothetical protein